MDETLKKVSKKKTMGQKIHGQFGTTQKIVTLKMCRTIKTSIQFLKELVFLFSLRNWGMHGR